MFNYQSFQRFILPAGPKLSDSKREPIWDGFFSENPMKLMGFSFTPFFGASDSTDMSTDIDEMGFLMCVFFTPKMMGLRKRKFAFKILEWRQPLLGL